MLLILSAINCVDMIVKRKSRFVKDQLYLWVSFAKSILVIIKQNMKELHEPLGKQ